MKNILSLIACCIIGTVLLQYRVINSDICTEKPLKVTEWDAFGYYMYLPAIGIYHDYKQLNWLNKIDEQYKVTGGNGWQAIKLEDGNYTFKYLGGVALMQTPFFLIGHWIAKSSNYPPDGFSPPYQYALAFGVIFYCILAVFLLRSILLVYFSDVVVSITLLMVCLATNFIQYAAVDNGQSHAYIFPLYTLVLYTTMRWHKKPGLFWASLTGWIIGLAMMSRPTEAIMLFIPLLWNTHNKDAAKDKWDLVREHKTHVVFIVLFGIIGILPQLIYWKLSTGSFIYDVGSKWDFLNPHFRVLLGWEKGWFIYTPVTIFFVAGLFFIKRFDFKNSVLWFCLLNIYIIIAWSDWRYGGSYSTRALMQSYPVFALPFAAFTKRVGTWKWKPVFYVVCCYLLFLNLFQTWQYDTGVLHHNDMNKRYYSSIYLDLDPSPVDMSLLDSNEVITNESRYKATLMADIDTSWLVQFEGNSSLVLYQASLNSDNERREKIELAWLKITAEIEAPDHLWATDLHASLQRGDSVKNARVRLYSPISKNEDANSYAFYMSVPAYFKSGELKVYLSAPYNFSGTVRKLSVVQMDRQ